MIATKSSIIDRDELIKSYGFVEQVSANENFLQESIALASRITDSSIVYISLLDNKKQYILSQQGIKLVPIDTQDSFCQFTIQQRQLLLIEDARKDDRTKQLSQVSAENGIVFYAGYPLVNTENIAIGALCIMDYKAKKLSESEIDSIRILANQIMTTLDNQRDLIRLIKKINSNFKPAVCADLSCLQGELAHLHDEVFEQHQLIKKQKAKLETTNKELSSFAHMVAHDAKAPLRTIGNFVMLLEKDFEKKAINYNQEFMHLIKDGVSNVNNLINDLLAFAVADHDNVVEAISLNKILELVLFNLTEQIKTSNANIILPEKDYLVLCPKAQLIQLLQNLISNGVKYQHADNTPIITIQTSLVNNKVKVSIIDNGIGIPADYLEKIFKPFVRLHPSSQFTGSGIGLATCKKIFDHLNADYAVKSEVNVGSEFSFDLPLV